MDNKQSNDTRFRELALFAGAGGGILGGKLLGWRTVCAVERDAYAAAVLAIRQNDRHIDSFPIWSDVCTFDGKPWKGIVDVISGGFPCQDISIAGKGAGLDGSRSGLWSEFARIIGEVRPQFVFVENSPALTFRGLGRVLGDLSEMGFNAEWGIVSAADAGAPHERKRIWIVADAIGEQNNRIGRFDKQRRDGMGRNEKTTLSKDGLAGPDEFSRQGEKISNADSSRRQRLRDGTERGAEKFSRTALSSWWETEPELGRVAHGVANRMDRLKAIGNGQVSRVAQLAWEILNHEN